MIKSGSQQKEKGFTLLEFVVSLGLLIMVFGGVTSVAILSSDAERTSKNNLISAFLASEAQELLRYRRDLNYILDASAFHDIAVEVDDTPYSFTINYDGSIASSATSDVTQTNVMEIASNFYSHSAGTDTIFRRLVTTTYHEAEDPLPARIDILVQVYWRDGTKQDTYELRSELQDWE